MGNNDRTDRSGVWGFSTRTPESPRPMQLVSSSDSARPTKAAVAAATESTRTAGPAAMSGRRNSTEGDTGQAEEIHLSVETEDAVKCFMQTTVEVFQDRCKRINSVYREIYARKGSIVWESKISEGRLKSMQENLQNTSLGCRHDARFQCCCVLRLKVPKGQYVAIEMSEHSGYDVLACEAGLKSVVVNGKKVRDRKRTNVLVSTSNVVYILHVVATSSAEAATRFTLRFQSLYNRGLQVTRTSSNTGVVRTPFSEGLTYLLERLTHHRAQLSVPPGHVILITVPMFENMKQCVALYAGDRRKSRALKKNCYHDFRPLRAAIFNTSSLVVQELCYNARSSECTRYGFRLLFSFLSRSALRLKLAENSAWNCSFLRRSVLLHHLKCNMEVECQDAEDEAGCFYTTDFCGGPGYLTLGGACFFLLARLERPVNWAEASRACSSRGGSRMASLSTASKWRDAVKVLSLHQTYMKILVGLGSASASLPFWYAGTYQWTDGTTAFFLKTHEKGAIGSIDCTFRCGYIDSIEARIALIKTCGLPSHRAILCERPASSDSTPASIPINGTAHWPQGGAYIQCPLGHFTHLFLACDVKSTCWSRDRSSSRCRLPETAPYPPPDFTCTDIVQQVPFTLLCDHCEDCADGSDEEFCAFAKCREISCGTKQCVSSAKVCNRWKDCHNGRDEDLCVKTSRRHYSILPPAAVHLPSLGFLIVQPLKPSSSSQRLGQTCPHTHFQCLDDGYCLPIVLRCNGVFDCPGREDEEGCDTCPGFYRCRATSVCLHYSDLCDGHPHCLQQDDELLCDLVCPSFCVCRGLAFFCRQSFTASEYPLLRFLDASESDITPADLSGNALLICLTCANCGLENLNGLSLPNLLSLDVRENRLKTLSRVNLTAVRELSVAGNPLALVFESGEGLGAFPDLRKLDLSRVVMHVLNITSLSVFPKLQILNLSHSGLQRVQGVGFRITEQLRVLDLRGCPMTWFPREMFQDLSQLQVVHAQNFRLCCPAVLPLNFNLRSCFAPWDEISSCDNLLRGNEYSVCVFVLSLFAMLGNCVSFIFRTRSSKQETKLGYANFVTHLSVSDFLMGVYLAIVGVADQVYRGTYVWNDVTWRHSATCQFAGFLSLLSSEVSTLIMCLITLDRFLVLRFPFSHLHFSPASAHVASVVAWGFVALLLSIPLMPLTSHWEFYSQTGICIPLPITRRRYAGQSYSFGILVVFNFIIFVFISIGQLVIYWSVRANAMSVSNTTKKTKDLTIARRLITVAMSDFLCWFPVGVFGLLASSGVPISGEVNVALAIFVIPLNSAVNPCLYTFNVIMERRSIARVEKLRVSLLAQHKAGNI